jgi:hypothetical protein
LKTIRMSRDFDYAPTTPRWLVALKGGHTIARVPEAAVKAIIEAGAGELSTAVAQAVWPKPRGKRRWPLAG